jgi:osmotically-inducible protein OsmY
MHKRSAFVVLALLLVAFVGSSCRSLPEITGDDLDPAAIEAAIRSEIAAKYPGETFDIGISVTEEGVVTLSGTIDTATRRQEIGEIARSVHDVERVINDLTVG